MYLFKYMYFNSTVFNIRRHGPWVNLLQYYFSLNFYQQKNRKVGTKKWVDSVEIPCTGDADSLDISR